MSVTSTGFKGTELNSPTMACNQITINNAPIAGTDGVNKDYVSLLSGGFNFKNTCYASTTADLNATYNNGAAGVGATLTNAGTQAAFSTDGVSPALNARILVQLESNQAHNGIYTLTTVGNGSTNWVLTRAADYDQPADIQPGDIIPVSDGTLYADSLWLQTEMVATIGTDPINFNEFLGQIDATQYELLVGGAANTVQSLGDTGTTGQVLTSQGAGMNPMWATIPSGFNSINTYIITSNQTYTPTSGTVYLTVCCTGGGGASGGAPQASNVAAGGGGGGAGGTAIRTFMVSEVLPNVACVIGGGGSANGQGDGSPGGPTNFGGFIEGRGGGGGGSSNGSFSGEGGSGGGASGSNAILFTGSGGTSGIGVFVGGVGGEGAGGAGGSSYFGGGARGQVVGNGQGTSGIPGQWYGGGASGGCNGSGGTGTGANGYQGCIVIQEFILS